MRFPLNSMFKIPRGYETTQKTIRLPLSLAEQLEKLAYKYSISFNQLVVACIKYALSNMVEEDSD